MPDFIIVGQGLAGTALAWALLDRGADVQIIERGDCTTASRIAAGLITPISGQRFTLSAGFDQFRVLAQNHYERVSELTGASFFSTLPALRFATSSAELDALEKRRSQLKEHIKDIDPAPAPGINPQLCGIQMPHAARLDVNTYLDTSAYFFRARNRLINENIDPALITIQSKGIRLNNSGLSAQQIIFCGGYADALNPWLPKACFDAAKGEILTVRIGGFEEQRTIHATDCWLVPTTTGEVYRCGATYDHEDLCLITSEAARDTLCARLAAFMTLPFEVLAQSVAVRPIGKGRKPLIARHPQYPQIAWLNGLGSKGALWAPTLAQRLADHLLHDAPLDALPGYPHGDAARKTGPVSQ